jgi:glycosyltransferase domain-containing protein
MSDILDSSKDFKVQEMDDETDYSKMKDCTIVIPTYNRPAYLRRILGYYDRMGIPVSIIVADSSSDKNIKDLNRDICKECLNLNIQYRGSYISNQNGIYKVIDAVQQVSTPYVVFCADDDFMIPRGVIRMMEFLSSHPEYKVAHGQYLKFLHNCDRDEVKYYHIHKEGTSVDHESTEKRLIHHAKHYIPTFYCVHETEFLQKIFAYSKDSGLLPEYGPELTILHLPELYPTWLTVIYSRVCKLPLLYYVSDATSIRLYDEDMKKFNHVMSDPYDLIMGPLICNIRRQTGMGESDAAALAHQIITIRLQLEPNNQGVIQGVIKGIMNLKSRFIQHMAFILPRNQTGNWIRRCYKKQFRQTTSDEYVVLSSLQLNDIYEYQDCCRIQDAIRECNIIVSAGDIIR